MTSEFWKRVAFTVGALLVFRLGSYIPLPGINPAIWEQLFRQYGGGVLGVFNTTSGGAVSRLSIFALAIIPYVSASILLQLIIFLVPRVRALRDSGERGRAVLDRATIALTVLPAAFQSYGIATALESVRGLVAEPGLQFRLMIIVTLTGGAIVVTWLASQITARGIGNGVALILCLGIVLKLPADISGTLQLWQGGIFSTNALAGLSLFAFALVVVVVVMERAQRREPVEFAGQGVSRRADLSFKLNSAGVMPAVIASWVLAIPLIVTALLGMDPDWIVRKLSPGQPLHLVCYAAVLFVLVFLYTAFVVDPAGAAEKLARLGGAIPNVPPGEPTAAYLDSVVSRLTLLGALYFVAICLIPELLLYRLNLPVYLGGTSLLVLVCTVIDIEKQARAFASR